MMLVFDVQVPTMILRGEKDVRASVDILRHMPNSKVFSMKNAGHACYIDYPDEWHRLLYSFLNSPIVFRDWASTVGCASRWKGKVKDLMGTLH